MSFSRQVKLEISENRLLKSKFKVAFAYGLFLYSNNFSEEEISLSTRQSEVAETFVWLAHSFLGKNDAVKTKVADTNGKSAYKIWIAKKEERAVLIEDLKKKIINCDLNDEKNSDELYAFFAGAFLSCGNITDPQKSYHLEFVVPKLELANLLKNLLDKNIDGFKVVTRRNKQVIYCKECSVIEDFLTMIGATKACLDMIDIEMIKTVRNEVNRQTNCETANIGKQVTAATSQIMDINLIFETGGEESLSENLLETANLRLANPHASLNELVELSKTSVSRSGLNHRLSSISKLAEEIRNQQKRERANV